MLIVAETHPVQYHAPIYRVLQQRFKVPIVVIYGSDFSVAGYYDEKFETKLVWDSDLLSGYKHIFLSHVNQGGAVLADKVRPAGVRKHLLSLRPNALLLLGYNHYFYQSIFIQARLAKVPVIFRGETTDHARHRNAIKACLRDTALRWFYRQCFRLLYIGQRSLAHYERLECPADKLFFSPYSVDTGSFHCEESDREPLRLEFRQSLDIKDSEKVIMFSGKFYEHKRPQLILHAIKRFPAELRDSMTVVFVGDGKLRPVLSDLAAEPPSTKVRFVGFQNQTQLSRCYHGADLLILPSLSETWGLVVNDALHHGLPCVVSDHVGCALDLIKPAVSGEIFSVDSVEGLILAIKNGLKLSNRMAIREKCRQIVNAYTIEKAAEGIARAYHDIEGRV